MENSVPYLSGKTINFDALRDIRDPLFVKPTKEDVAAMKAKSGRTIAELGGIVGVEGRTVRRWLSGDVEIPYPAWFTLLYKTGIMTNQDLSWSVVECMGGSLDGHIDLVGSVMREFGACQEVAERYIDAAVSDGLLCRARPGTNLAIVGTDEAKQLQMLMNAPIGVSNE